MPKLTCGNGVRDGGEQCDGTDLGGATCVSLGFDSGSLACTATCQFNTAGCRDCGNGMRETGEQCDGADLGGATCAAQQCTGGTPTCTATCTLNYGGCTGCPICDGDGTCESGERCTGCPGDCISGSGASCGNGFCEAGNGEDCVSCAQDCRGQQGGKPSGRYCCGDGGGLNPVTCADARCTASPFRCTNVPAASYCCGDGQCTGLENGSSCTLDCGPPPTCGDHACNGDETPCTCATDCPVPAENCSDGVDNDCDQAVDCADSNCAGQPGCVPTCAPLNATCSVNSACCSNKCRGGRCR